MPKTTYLLMNKNHPLLSFYAKETICGYRFEKIETFVETKFLPPRFNNIDTWISKRNYAKRKEHLQPWLHEWGIDNGVGFIVDNDTFEILRFAPVFDHNMALLARAMQSDLDDFEHYYRGLSHKIDGEFVDVARKLLTPDIRTDVETLTDFAFTEDDKYNLPPERLAFLSKAVRKQVRGILSSEGL